MKLVSLKLPDLPYLGSMSHFALARPDARMIGWSVKVRGLATFLVSPPGWEPGLPLPNRKADGPRRVFGPLEGVVLVWEGDGAVDALKSYDSEPMGAVEVPALSEDEMERVTAPKTKAAGGR